ncbi:MAG TPA: cobyrinate a,c-diamide synthase [Gemmataceae bacterium]|jgi:cobyrinic acid a,c-diamide synthase|nr:cobyrinate a,c-diamide synthase [Gemmataceae bacterium]
MVKSLVIAGTHSGVGKTTIVIGLIAALRARGLTVQPFKIGPDFIDPSHHTLAAGRPCRNLDTWMMPPERMMDLCATVARGADVAVIEGVMGLFDGLGYDDETGSTAQVAKLLHAPVLLVIDAAKMARSAAAIATGFQRFDSRAPLAGFLVNRAGSESHGQGVAGAIAAATGLPVLGWLPRDDSLHIPERYLGLVPSAEPGNWSEFAQAAGKMVAKCIDVDKILGLAGDLPSYCARSKFECSETDASPRNTEPTVIAVARDEAFHFCYEENLTLLKEGGATLKFFSPLQDSDLPRHTAGILLSGGFPELFAARLSANTGLHQALRAAHAQGLPIYAECGGLMYITEAIVDLDGRVFQMAGLLPGRSVMTRRLTLGYREARAIASSWLFRKDETVRGHEFHYSNWEGRPKNLAAAYDLVPPTGKGEPRGEGANLGSLWASYIHLHFWGKPELASRFVAACKRRCREPSGTTPA